ncbi:MAG: DUF3592 domain-containing protein [Bacteroidales bacterium]|nr:DUF3592 domain-containing protein [Bacteroidales bacterium]
MVIRIGNTRRRKPGNANPITLGIIFALVGGAIFFVFALPPLQYASSSKISAGEAPMDNNVNSAKQIQAKYPVGKEVTVWYDPGLPASSALEPGIKTGDILLASIAAIFFLVGIFSFYKGLKAKKVIDESKKTLK